ncbi:2-aminoethylphosphonate--pyruvate transaminase [Sphingomonas sp.]|uniref:2-aminoethylphosphonate--pyruvate transaminase n=1 Tax=Sphingomonas sp. TaxID=28214 RepID=UPI002B622E38|nr:2-aminoethylphosphonate--pyruvate transaminase [Sphingomonas sp.]HWK35227.1 2-aminoethylphosphonate--pyruvate transaminase [Sphingomonas sp.]
MTRPLLLTPGPLTTAPRVRRAMDADWGSRDPAFIALTAELRERLLVVANGAGTHVAVPIQGSGTYALEAAADTLIGPDDRLLVLINGAYGERMAAIARRLGRQVAVLHWEEDEPVDPSAVAAALRDDPAITHVAVVHVETTTGLRNPLEAIAATVADTGRRLIVDAMASFGALPIDLATLPAAAILASSNKCLEGPPGLAFALVDRAVLEGCAGRSRSTSLDLHAQWRGFEGNGQWRFTPPVQVVAATVEALRLLDAEGGAAARLDRYAANLDVLLAGAGRLGLELYLDRDLQAPIIATFRRPPDLDFAALYDALAARGFLIYPGKLTRGESFRIGCIGAVTPADFTRLVAALEPALAAARS